MKRLDITHPCDRAKVREIMLRLAEHVDAFYNHGGHPYETPDPDAYLDKRNELARELEWALR